MRKGYFFVLMFITSLAVSTESFAQLTPGNLVVYRIGTGAAALSANSTAVFLDEYSPSGTLVQSIAAPTAVSGANQILTASGTATTEGLLTTSADGQYVILAGYNVAPGTASITSSTSAAIPRVIGRLASTGVLNTTTALTDAISGSNPRGACSTNGTDLWISGSAAVGGIRYATLGATTSTSVSTTATNLRGANVFGGQLYISSGAGTIKVGAVGSGTPMTSGQTITALPGVSTTATVDQFFFADINPAVPGVDVLYIADEGSNVIQKYSLVAGTWTSNGTIAAAAVRGLTGTVSGTTVTLYYTYLNVTQSNKLATVTDATGYNTTVVASSQADLATAAANEIFRGVAMAPVAAATPVLSATPSTLNGFTATSGTASATQFFNVNGSNLTPANSTITVTSNSPSNIEVSSTGLAGSFSSSFTFTASGSTVTNVPVYVRLTNTATQGSISNTITVAGGGATTNVTITGTVVQTYYPLSSGSLTLNTNWGTNTDGTGSQPNNFTNDGQVFIVTNRPTITLDADWTVSGSSSKVVVGNGTTPTELIIPSTFTLTAPTDVANLGKLTLQNTTLPTLGTLSTGSTVEYAQATGTSILNTTNDAVTYYNLRLSGAGLKTFKGSTTTITNDLVYDGLSAGPLGVEAAAVSPFCTINLGGNLTYLGTVSSPSDVDSYTLNTTGTGTQTITGNGNTVRFFRINTAATNTVVLSNVGGTSNALLGNASGGGLTINAGTIFQLNGNNVTFFAGTSTGIIGTGTITGSPLSNMTINKIGTTAFGSLLFTSGSEQLNNLTINTTATTTPTVTLGTKLDLSGTLTLTAGKLVLGTNNLSTPAISGGSSTAYVVTSGTGALKILNVGPVPNVYPVGPSVSLYHPATIVNLGTVDNYAVKVASAAPPCADPAYSVTATWDIAEDVVGGSNCTITLDYTGAATGATYDASLAKIIHCTGATADYKNGSVAGTVATGGGFMNFSPFGISNDPLVLPVRITDLRGISLGKSNHLSWTTAQESLNSGFEIQRSSDGNNFTTIGFVQTKAPGGTSGIALNYSYDDYTFNGIKQYYRLRQVDLDGHSSLTNAILINSAVSTKLAIDGVYPNPTKDILNVSVSTPATERVTLLVSDLTGKKLVQEMFTAETGKNIHSLDISKLAPGMYTVQLLGSKDVSTIKFMKQ